MASETFGDRLIAASLDSPERLGAEARQPRSTYGGSADLVVSLSRSGRSVRLFTALGDDGYSAPTYSLDHLGLELHRYL